MASTRHRFLRVLGVACSISAVALAGCTGGGGGESTAPTVPVGDSTTTQPAPTGQSDQESPLEAFLGFRVAHKPQGLGTNLPALNPDAPAPTGEERRDQLRLEQMIADCMRAEGFKYEVVDPFGGAQHNPADSPYALPPETFASRYGYGISTIDIPTAAEVDPNYAAMAAMTASQREAYLWALDGGAEKGDTENTGCRGAAVKAVFGRSTVASAADEFAFLVEEIHDLGERVDGDPRVAGAANRRWSDCMADAGHPGLSQPQDAPDSVTTRLAQARAGDPAAVAEVRRYELALSAADFVCRQAYDSARRAVRDELERRFLDERRSELEQYRRAMNP
jgi:hypothetical protein